jgi:Spy/CpxP family protein refolding chaperone
MKQRFMKKFGVTDEQATKIEALKEAKEKAQRETSARQKIIRAEAEYLWMADKVDKKAIMAKYTEIEQLKRKSFTADVDFKYALTEVLTPQQRSELMNMMQQRRGKMGQRDMDSHQRGDRNQQNWQGQRGQGGFNQQNWQGQRGQGGFNQQIWQGQRGQGGFNQQNWQGQRGQGGYKQQGGQGYDDGGYDFDNVTDGDSL